MCYTGGVKNNFFDVVVIGAGHAGCEAAWAAAKLGRRVALVTINLDSVAFLACNPIIGGTGKGHLVCEIDALGGIMGIIADKTAIQIRMLNVGKGAAVFSLRAQADKVGYHNEMKRTLENIENITLIQAEVEKILTDNEQKKVIGVKLTTDEIINCASIVVATGVYLNSRILIGDWARESGPSGFAASTHLTKSLRDLGLEIRRFKTGTPPRVNGRTIDFSKTTAQHGDDGIQSFSFITLKPIKNVADCHLTYTNPTTHKIIRDNIHLSPMYSGKIEGIGARYCPSIEDKIVRFGDRERHQIFLEPESLSTNEIYLQGMSSSLPVDVQRQFVQSIDGLEHAHIMRNAYAIEYNCINSLQLRPTLEYKNINGLFLAGQVNGTSGYEEAAAQGLVAGVNAAISDTGKVFTLSRTNSYIGVLIDDLVTVGTNEPYRMFTSRAEHRLSLRQDNADLRLTPLGRDIGLVDDYRWKIYTKRLRQINKVRAQLGDTIHYSKLKPVFEKYGESAPAGSMTVEQCIKRARITLGILQKELGFFGKVPLSILDHVTIEIKYAGYLARENIAIADAKRREATALPINFDYKTIKGLRFEAQIKLNQIQPTNIAQASRISGVTPADINVLLVYLRKQT